MLEKIAKIRKWLCRALRGSFDNLRYVGSYAESYFLLSMIAAACFFGLVFYIMATQPVGLFPPMEPDVAACTQLKGELPFLSCEPEKIKQIYELRDKIALLMRPVKVEWENYWLGIVAIFLLLVAIFSAQLFRQAGFIEAHNKRKLGILPDPVEEWHKEMYGEPGRFENAMEAAYNWTERTMKGISKPFLPDEEPEPKSSLRDLSALDEQEVDICEEDRLFLERVDTIILDNISKSSFEFGINDLLEALHASHELCRTALNARLKRLRGCATTEYIKKCKINFAKKLFRSGMKPADVMKSVGYTDVSSFKTQFKKFAGGMTPTQYRVHIHTAKTKKVVNDRGKGGE